MCIDNSIIIRLLAAFFVDVLLLMHQVPPEQCLHLPHRYLLVSCGLVLSRHQPLVIVLIKCAQDFVLVFIGIYLVSLHA
jgi:hypothetical protein